MPNEKSEVVPPLFLFIGPPHCGKSTARKIFCEITKLKGASCSDVIYDIMANITGSTEAELRATDKEFLRPQLVELGDWLCNKVADLTLVRPKPDVDLNYFYRGPSALLRSLFLNGYRVIDGVRRRGELEDFRDRMAWVGLRVVVVWVERSKREDIADNSELEQTDANYVITNDGTPTELKNALLKWISDNAPKPETSPVRGVA